MVTQDMGKLCKTSPAKNNVGNGFEISKHVDTVLLAVSG